MKGTKMCGIPALWQGWGTSWGIHDSNVLHINHDDKKDIGQNIKNNARKADAYKF